MKLKPAFVLDNYRNTKVTRFFRVLGWGMTGLSLFGGKNDTFQVKAGKP